MALHSAWPKGEVSKGAILGITFEGPSRESGHQNEIRFVGCIREWLGLLVLTNNVRQGNANAAQWKACAFFECSGPLVPFVVFGEQACFIIQLVVGDI